MPPLAFTLDQVLRDLLGVGILGCRRAGSVTAAASQCRIGLAHTVFKPAIVLGSQAQTLTWRQL